MTNEALALQNKKEKLLNQYVTSWNEANHVRFVHVHNHLWGLIRRPRRNFDSHLASKLKDIVKPFWRYVNSQVKTKAVIEDFKRPDGSLTSSDQNKGDTLANSFANVFVSEHCSVPPVSQQ